MYQHICKFLAYTEGIQQLAEMHGAYWFVDLVASHLATNKKLRAEPFQLWRLKLDGEGGCIVTARRDSGEPAIVTQHVEYTDYPEDFECYCCLGEAWVLMTKEDY